MAVLFPRVSTADVLVRISVFCEGAVELAGDNGAKGLRKEATKESSIPY